MIESTHKVYFIIINKTLKKRYEEDDFKKASKLYEHKKKQTTKGVWQFIAKVV